MFLSRIVDELKQSNNTHISFRMACIEYLARTDRLFYCLEHRMFYVREADDQLHVGWYLNETQELEQYLGKTLDSQDFS